jgi:hypothetical protein
VFLVETSERIGPIIPNVLEIAGSMAAQIGNLGFGANNAALVHFSSHDSRTAVLFNLNGGYNTTTLQSMINNVNVPSILGITDLD